MACNLFGLKKYEDECLSCKDAKECEVKTGKDEIEFLEDAEKISDTVNKILDKE